MHQHFICGDLCLKTTICSVFISVLHLSLSAVVIVNPKFQMGTPVAVAAVSSQPQQGSSSQLTVGRCICSVKLHLAILEQNF